MNDDNPRIQVLPKLPKDMVAGKTSKRIANMIKPDPRKVANGKPAQADKALEEMKNLKQGITPEPIAKKLGRPASRVKKTQEEIKLMREVQLQNGRAVLAERRAPHPEAQKLIGESKDNHKLYLALKRTGKYAREHIPEVMKHVLDGSVLHFIEKGVEKGLHRPKEDVKAIPLPLPKSVDRIADTVRHFVSTHGAGNKHRELEQGSKASSQHHFGVKEAMDKFNMARNWF